MLFFCASQIMAIPLCLKTFYFLVRCDGFWIVFCCNFSLFFLLILKNCSIKNLKKTKRWCITNLPVWVDVCLGWWGSNTALLTVAPESMIEWLLKWHLNKSAAHFYYQRYRLTAIVNYNYKHISELSLHFLLWIDWWDMVVIYTRWCMPYPH